MRPWFVAVLVVVLSGTALAQGYVVGESNEPALPRPAAAVRVDVDVADVKKAFAPVPLPFEFRYYGERHASVVVSGHGFVLPGAAGGFEGAHTIPAAFPFAGAADGAIAPLWVEDEPPEEHGPDRVRVWAWTAGSAPQRRFVVSWELVAGGDVVRTAQVHLHEGPGRIGFAYSAPTVTGAAEGPPWICGLDEPGGRRFVTPVEGGRGASAAPPAGYVFEPRTVLFNEPGIGNDGAAVAWKRVRKESTIPDGCTKRCTYLAKGHGIFFVPDRALATWKPERGFGSPSRDTRAKLVAEDRETFGGERGDMVRFVRQVLDGKMVFMPASGAAPQRVWFRIVEYFSLDDRGTTGADLHTWNLRRMLSNAFPPGDPRGKIDRYYAWKAMARGRLTVGKLFKARESDDLGTQYNSGRGHEYCLWAGRLRAGTRGALAPYASPGEEPASGWVRFTLEEDDERRPQHADREDLRFVADPNYVDGHYDYLIRADDNPFGWVTGRGLPREPWRGEDIDVDPGRKTGPVTPK